MQKPVTANNKTATINTVFNLTHVSLDFEKGYDKMKHVNFNLYQNTNTAILIETNFYKHNQEHFLFLLRMNDFSAAWEVPGI